MQALLYSQNLAPSSRKTHPLQTVALVLRHGLNLNTRTFISPTFTVNPVGVFFSLLIISMICFLKWFFL
jgi:hypothetical protein